MGTVFGIVAVVVALIGLLAALGHVGYLALLSNAARQRGAAGAPTTAYVKDRWALAGGTAAVAAVGLLLTTTGDGVPDAIGLLLGGGAGFAAKQALDSTRTRFRGGS